MSYTGSVQVRTRLGLSTTDISDATIGSLIAESDAEINLTTGQNFSSGNSVTLQIGPTAKDAYGNHRARILLPLYPVQSLGSIVSYNFDGTSGTTYWAGSDFWNYSNSFGVDGTTPTNQILEFKSNIMQDWPNNMKVTYQYGYNTVPVVVAQLSEVLTAMKAWINFLGGNYAYPLSYSIPEQSVTKGDIYQRGMQAIEQLRKEAEELYKRIGKRNVTQFFSSGWSTPTRVVGYGNQSY